jgi:hypothetical protein
VVAVQPSEVFNAVNYMADTDPVCKEHFPSRGGIPPESRMAFTVAGCYARYSHVHWMFESPTISQFPITAPPGWGFSLPVVYLIWASLIVALYPLCRWFAGLMLRRGDAWLSYL